MITLNGHWKFTCDLQADYKINTLNKKAEWRNAKVPLSWQAQFEDLRDYQGIGWYKKNISLPSIKPTEAVILQFGAVDYFSKVYVNGKFVGRNEGGFTPFELDITNYIIHGDNEIVVRVMDPAITTEATDGINYWNIPHGKQNWYIETSGIWQPAQIIIKPKRYVRAFHLTPDVSGDVAVSLKFSKVESTSAEDKIILKISDPAHREVFAMSKTFSSEEPGIKFNFKIPSPELWHFDHPNLYTAELTFGEDKVTEQFGFRSIEAKEGMLYLNGEPFYLLAALDQDFYPDTIYSTPSEEYLRDQMMKAKKLGLNMLRCHIKVPDPLYLKVADELGLLVWSEVPNWEVFSFEAAKRGRQTFDKMLERDWNHPCIIILTLMNESWGIDLQKEIQREWLINEFDRAKRKVKGRYLIVDNSPCTGNFHVKTDINDYHTYWAIPENRHTFDDLVKDFATRPAWLFSCFGDAQETKKEPLIISEFGNWGLPELPEELPWWFNRKYKDVEVSLPENVHHRFDNYKYDKIFGTYNELARESQKAQFTSLKYEIESIRLQNAVQGYVVTEFTDLNWESNGLLDIWRNPKIFADKLVNIQQQDIIIPRPEKYTYRENEVSSLKLWISHYSSIPFEDLKLRWFNSDGSSGEMTVPFISRAEVLELPSLKIKLNEVSSPEKNIIRFELYDKSGKILARNFTEIYVFPIINTHYPDVNIYSPAGKLKTLNDNDNPEADIIITDTIDERILNKLQDGLKVICFADKSSPLPPNFPLKIKGRDADWLDGNWASNFNWIKSDRPPFKGISFAKHFGFETALTAAQNVITGIHAENYSDVLAGMFVGWIHSTSGFVVQMNAGKGKLILCTIPVMKNINTDPYSENLFNNLVKYISGNEFRASLSWHFD